MAALQLGTDALLFGVVIAIALNRVFQASSLSLSRPAYVLAQSINMSFVFGLFSFRISEFTGVPRAELGVRLFLMCFVAWHMVRNSQCRTKALRFAYEDQRVEQERKERMDVYSAAVRSESEESGNMRPDKAD